MGYLKMEKSLGDIRKATVSLWFRVPQESIDKSLDFGENTVFWGYRVYLGVIPLLSWGKQHIFHENAPMPPSYIGVRTGGHSWNYGAVLDVHIQTADTASGSGEDFVASDEPEYFGNSECNATTLFVPHPKVLIDRWNHLLLSWELVSHSNASTECTMYCAINDENKSGYHGDPNDYDYDGLPAMINEDAGGPNNHFSYTAYVYTGFEHADVDVSVSEIESDPVIIPQASVDYATGGDGETESRNPTLRVQLAELQIFTEKSLDTSVTANRRAFVDQDGKPVAPDAIDGDGNFIGSRGVMGKWPEVLLSGGNAWEQGLNSGSLGFDYSVEPPKMKMDGHFTPTGNIKTWTPDPSLFGPQSRTVSPDIRLTKRNLVTS